MQSDKIRNLSQFVMVGQLGLSLLVPLLLCLFLCYYLTTRFSIGGWVYIPGFILGLGGSCMTAWKVYLSVLRKDKDKTRSRRGADEVSFNRHH